MFSRRQRCSSWIRAWWTIALSLLALLGSTSAYSSGGSSSGSSYPSCSYAATVNGDGYCDNFSNNEECGYDGGDCCSCSCISTGIFECGSNGFSCIDPWQAGFDCSGSTSTATTSYPSCFGLTDYIGDGECDSSNNNQECGYDRGDCCSCTCIDDIFECGKSGFLCNDPSAPCFGEDEPVSTTSTTGDDADEGGCTLDWKSDGFCDSTNNTEECSYDGGDCCVCTCVTADYDCTSGFNCVDPEADCTDGVRTGADGSLCTDSLIGNGQCDGSNNSAECLFDGGDCCSGKRCDSDDCIDPNSHCSGTASTKPSLETRSRSNLMKVFIGVGAGCVGLVIAACLVMRCVNVMLEKRRRRKAQEASATTVEQ